MENSHQLATLGTGCFWCTEAIFKRLKGILSVESGYSGGNVNNPTYEQVSRGDTGHAEVIQIVFDPTQISFKKLLDVFFKTHDPTTLNQQGADIGTQYRSVIFYHDSEQQQQSEAYIKDLNDNNIFKSPVVTQVVPYTKFYKAENYHQDFYNNNQTYPYCRIVIDPKLDNFIRDFEQDLKP